MADFGEILGAFEENLILARELGARTIECDRSLLSPLRQTPPKSEVQPIAENGPEVRSPEDVPAPASNTASSTASSTTTAATSSSTLLLLAAKRTEKGTPPAELMGKMVSATGLARSELAFIETPPAPSPEEAERLAARAEAMRPKAIVLFGSEAMKAFARAGCTARRGVWGSLRGIPAVATLHPEFMLAMWGRDEAALRKGKLEVWHVLKEALARIGRKPPGGK